jgi:hypothetical protein
MEYPSDMQKEYHVEQNEARPLPHTAYYMIPFI